MTKDNIIKMHKISKSLFKITIKGLNYLRKVNTYTYMRGHIKEFISLVTLYRLQELLNSLG